MKRMKLSEDEVAMINDYRLGKEKAESKEQEAKEAENKSEKEDENMKDGMKKGLKIAGIGAAVAAVAGGIGYGIYRIFFKDPSGLDDFDDEYEDDDDLFEEDEAEDLVGDLDSSDSSETESK